MTMKLVEISKEGILVCPVCKSNGLTIHRIETSAGLCENSIQMKCPHGHVGQFFIRRIDGEVCLFWSVPNAD